MIIAFGKNNFFSVTARGKISQCHIKDNLIKARHALGTSIKKNHPNSKYSWQILIISKLIAN